MSESLPGIDDEKRFDQARDYVKVSQPLKAYELLHQLVANNPGHQAAWEELASVVLTLSDQSMSESLLAEARERKVSSNRFWYILAQAFDGTSAQECYRFALQCNPDDEQSLMELAWNLRTSGDKDNAAKLYRYLIHIYNERSDWRALNSLGDTLRRLVKNLDDAEDALRKSLEIKPDNFSAWKNLTYLMCSRADLAGAQRTVRGFIQQYPDHPDLADAWVCLANVLRSFDDLSGAEEAVRQALLTDPESQSAWSKLADIRFEQGDLQEGEEALQKANELDYNRKYDTPGE